MMRIVIFKKDLLFPLWIYPVHVVLLGLSALVGGVLIFWKRRVTVVSLADTLEKKRPTLTVQGRSWRRPSSRHFYLG